MKSNTSLQNEFSVASTVMRLALLGGTMISGLYGTLWVFASAVKFLI